jgi:glycosyltransferase involved in cell wall biosynthesis
LKIFIASTSLLSSYGGPAYSVARLARELATSQHDVGLWSADGSRPSIDVSCRILAGTLTSALREFGTPDVIHDNGLWLPHNHSIAAAADAANIPRVLSTRGMLEPWARAHKRLKKSIAWRFYQRKDVARASSIHATSAVEAANIVRMNLSVPVSVIPNGVDLPQSVLDTTVKSATRVRRAVFIGRLHPVKGLPMLIEAWSRVQPADWILQIAGPDEAGHRTLLEKQIEKAQLGNVISFTGTVHGDAKDEILVNADLFVLPTHSESFGMAVAEALSYAVPVLTTLAAPWPAIIERKCGWLAEPTPDGIAAALNAAISVDDAARQAMGRRGRAFVESELSWQKVASDFDTLYRRVIST